MCPAVFSFDGYKTPHHALCSLWTSCPWRWTEFPVIVDFFHRASGLATPKFTCISTFCCNAQRRRRGCLIPPEWMLNLSGHAAQSRAEYSRSRIKRIVRLYSSRNCIDPLVDTLNFLRCVEKLHLQVCVCKVYPLSQLIQFVFIWQFQNTHLPYNALIVSINWLILIAPGKRFSSFSNTM